MHKLVILPFVTSSLMLLILLFVECVHHHHHYQYYWLFYYQMFDALSKEEEEEEMKWTADQFILLIYNYGGGQIIYIWITTSINNNNRKMFENVSVSFLSKEFMEKYYWFTNDDWLMMEASKFRMFFFQKSIFTLYVRFIFWLSVHIVSGNYFHRCGKKKSSSSAFFVAAVWCECLFDCKNRN